MDNLFDFNQGTTFSPRASSRTSARAGPSNVAAQVYSEEDGQIFAGPSHEYDRFPQQTGVGVDLSALNQPMPDGFNMGGFNSGIDESSFGMGWNSGVDMDADMSMDFNNQAMFKNNFVDPTQLDGYEEPQSDVGRLWPGMHQQAALAKAQQQQQQPQNNKGKGRAPQPNDPHTEESISRLLNQMRQGSALSSIAEDDTASLNGSSMSRMKKAEEEMDEDERLLASEEGKKLSSKERRQLRNKVSARAFRSRRKEYIGQLEGEVAVKAQENTVLKNTNDQLAEENARYRALIQTLLRHPSFTPFIEDISKDPAFIASQAQLNNRRGQSNAQQEIPQQMSKPTRNMMPEAPVDLSMLNINNAVPSQQNMNFDFSQPQIFNAQSFPQGPSQLDIAMDTRDSFFGSHVSHSNRLFAPTTISRMDTQGADSCLSLYAVHSSPRDPYPQASPVQGRESCTLLVGTCPRRHPSSRWPTALSPPVASISKGSHKSAIRQCLSSIRAQKLTLNNAKKTEPEKMGGVRATPMKSFLQYLTTPTSDTRGTTLLVHFDRKRYLFGSAGEGLQRAAIQQGAKVLKISEVFISGRTEWSNIGGLLGLVLVLADGVSSATAAAAEQIRAKVFGKSKQDDLTREEYDRKQAVYLQKLNKERQSLTIYGPGGLNYMLATARRFIFRTGMPLSAHEVPALSAERNTAETGPATFLFKDDFIRVWGLHTAPTSGNETPRNERKRSHEEMQDVQPNETTTSSLHEPESVLELARKVVFEMFSSDWRIDRLFSCPLDEVKLPAKIFVRNPVTKKIENYTGPLPGQPGCDPKEKVLIRSPWPGAVLSERLPAPPPAKDSISYIVRTYPQRGKFDPKKALELGLKDKSKWSTLTMGESLQNDKGDTITPDMVLEPPKDATGFFVADLPSRDYVQPFLDQVSSLPSDIIDGVGAYCWILGKDVFEDATLQEFISSKSGLQHMVAAPGISQDRFSFDSAASATIKLSAIDPVRYRVPHIVEASKSQALPQHVTLADRGQIFQLEPTNKLINDQVNVQLDVDTVLDNVVPEARVEADKAEAAMLEDQSALNDWMSKVVDPNAEVITIGTGSALPSKYRNVSGTLVRVPGWGSILLDAGENTVGQLRRVYSPDEFAAVMRDLRCIWISHLHADHHLGTASVIKTWYQTVHNSVPAASLNPASPLFNPVMHLNRSPQLIVMSDSAMLHWLFEYSQLEDFGYSHVVPIAVTPASGDLDRATLLNWFVPPALPSDEPPLSPRIQRIRTRLAPFSLGFADVQACHVRHCNNAMAVSVTLPSGFKLSYSGDCRPSGRFVEMGKGSTVLVHEATFDDELKNDAIAKRHSTTGEALMVGAQMGAKAVVLTHFSQRYAKVPVLEYEDGPDARAEEKVLEDDVDDDGDDVAAPTAADEDAEDEGKVGKATFKLHANKDMKVCIAFDYMRVKVGDIAKMEKYVPALLALYEGEERKRAEERTREREELERKAKEKGKGKNKWAEAQGQNNEKKEKAGKQKRKNTDGGKDQAKENGSQQAPQAQVAEKSAADDVRDALKNRRRNSQMDTTAE
ncbi:hypothetical protein BDZ85DRAFT_201711 [Elsinoe ampelina]|uniref:ribonuclease Z n=1 Tax=Elsinoe ampelina TaxID=302913 RepID=A0A6A6G7H0_9PEZI|nr:hypothetical protein BDZ85DRAFT_201711 [Elsinoe ampelina]